MVSLRGLLSFVVNLNETKLPKWVLNTLLTVIRGYNLKKARSFYFLNCRGFRRTQTGFGRIAA